MATELLEALESTKSEASNPSPAAPANEPPPESVAAPGKVAEPRNQPPGKLVRKEVDSALAANSVRPPPAKAPPPATGLPPANRPPVANAPRPPAPPVAAVPLPRPNSNVSFVLQPVMGGAMPPLFAPRLPPPGPLYPNAYYEYSAGPWHFAYESFDQRHGNVNLNFGLPPKNLVVNGRGSAECKNACGSRPGPGPEGEPLHYGPPPQNQGCWIKPTIFYDGFWTEQKVKKWVAEQVEKQFPEDPSQKTPSPSNGQPEPSGSKS